MDSTLDGVMDKNTSPERNKTHQTPAEAPFTTFIQLDGISSVPSQFRTAGTFSITRLQSPVGLPDRVTKSSRVPALLVSVSLKSLPSSSYRVWVADKLIATPAVQEFRSNIIDWLWAKNNKTSKIRQEIKVGSG